MRLDDAARVHWPLNPFMPARFTDLFVNDCSIESIPTAAVEHKSWRLAILPADVPYLPAGFATVGAGAHPIVRGLGKFWWTLSGREGDRYRYMVFPKQFSKRSTRADARHLDFEYERIPEYFRLVYRPFFERVQPRPEILRKVEHWAKENLDDTVIGVQVRTWRDDPRRYRKYHQPSIKRLRRLLASAGPERRFFVVSDSDDILPWLASEYGKERVLGYPRETERHLSWQSVEGISEDLIDMLLLARTKQLFASYLSTFSETAWWLGRNRARVSVF